MELDSDNDITNHDVTFTAYNQQTTHVAYIENGEAKSVNFNWGPIISYQTLIDAGFRTDATTWSTTSVINGISIGSNIQKIDQYAFDQCYALSSLLVPNSVTAFGEYAFNGCSSLTFIKVPNSVSALIDASIFGNCSSLDYVVIPDSVTAIASTTFQNCSNTSGVFLDRNIDQITTISQYDADPTKWGLGAVVPGKDFITVHFVDDSIKSYFIDKELLSSDVEEWYSNGTPIQVAFGQEVLSIGNSALLGRSSLSAITGLSSIEAIGANAFMQCNNIGNLILPLTLTSIGQNAFAECPSIKVYFDGRTTDEIIQLDNYPWGLQQYQMLGTTTVLKDIGLGTLAPSANARYDQTSDLSLVNLPTVFYSDIHFGTICADVFRNCSRLTSITLQNVDIIEDNAFDGCTSLVRLALPGVPILGNVFGDDRSAFSSLIYLSVGEGTLDVGTSLSGLSGGVSAYLIPGSQQNVSAYTQLKTIYLPSTLSCINSYALLETAIEYLNVPSSAKLYENCFSGILNINSLSIPLHDKLDASTNLSSLLSLSKVHLKKISNGITLGNALQEVQAAYIEFEDYGSGITALSTQSFDNCAQVTTIDLSKSSIMHVPTSAFSRCSQLCTVYFPQTLSSLEHNCFIGCDTFNMQGFAIPSTITSIEDIGINKFFNIPSQLERIGASAFNNAIFINDQHAAFSALTSIGEYAFGGEYGTLSSASISAKCSIPSRCFYENSKIQAISIDLSEDAAYIGESAFMGCSELLDFCLSSTNMISIRDYAFNSAAALPSIDFSYAYAIGNYAFADSGISDIDHNGIVLQNVSSIGNNAFANCIGISMIGMPKSVNYGNNVLFGCSNISTIRISSTYQSFYEANHSQHNLHRISSYMDPAELKLGWGSIVDMMFGQDTSASYTQTQIIFDNGFILCSTGQVTQEWNCLSIDDNTLMSVYVDDNTDFDAFTTAPDLPNEITYINSNAFDVALTKSIFTRINLNQAQSIYADAFKDSDYMATIYAQNLSAIPDRMCQDANALTAIYADAAQSIGENAFSHCSHLSTTSFKWTKCIHENAFLSCESMQDIQLPAVEIISSQAFAQCTSLVSAYAPDALSVDVSAFFGCINLISIDGMSQLDSIGASAFMGCNGLQKIDLGKIRELPSDVLSGCIDMQHIVIPQQLTSLGSNSLRGLQPNILTIDLQGKAKTSIGQQLSSQLISNSCDAPYGTRFYTSDNNYAHPSYIAVHGKTLEVNDIAFECEAYDDRDTLNLLSVDDVTLQSDNLRTSISIDQAIGHIDSISSAILTQITFLESQDISAMLLDHENTIAHGAFSKENVPSLNEVYATFMNYNEPYNLSKLSTFWGQTSLSNEQLTVYFMDGEIVNGEFIPNNDPFMKKNINGQYVIYAIDDNRVHGNVHQTIKKGNTISAYAFASNTYAYYLSNQITDLSVSDEAGLHTISSNAFSWNAALTCISTLGHSLSAIEDDAFANCGLHKITLPSSLNDNLNGVGTKGYGLEKTVALTSLSYEEGTYAIAPSAMVDCHSLLADLHFASTTLSIGDYAFAETYDVFPRIMNMNISSLTSLTSIGNYAFYNSISTLAANRLVLPSALLSIGDAAFAYNRYAYTQQLSSLMQAAQHYLDGGESLQCIGASAFMHNHFREIRFGDALSTISDYAFAWPKYKIGLHILSSIQSIGQNAFKDNIILNPENIKANIVSIDVELGRVSAVFGIPQIFDDYSAPNTPGFSDGTVVSAIWPTNNPYNSFAFVFNKQMNFCPANLSIDLMNRQLVKVDSSSIEALVPKYLLSIGPSAMIDCLMLQSVSAMPSIQIGEYAFYNCKNLRNIQSLDGSSTYSLSNVEAYSFFNCESLENVRLLSTTEYVNEAAFCNCYSIQQFYNDDIISGLQYFQLSSIGPSAFNNCSSLTAFQICPNIRQMSPGAFDGCGRLSSIEIMLDHQVFLEMAREWLNEDDIEIGPAVAKMFNGIREDGKCMISFTDIQYTNNGIVKIDNEFVDLYQYEEDGISKLGVSSVNADYDPSKQPFLNLSGVSKIDQFVFKDYNSIHSMAFMPDSSTGCSLEDIGDFAFYGCSKLMSFNANRLSCRNIGCYAFGNCQALATMNLDFSALSSIGQGAFYGTSLNTLYVSNCPPIDGVGNQSLTETLNQLKSKIFYDEQTNPNPLELPEYCNIILVDNSINHVVIGQYDYLFNDLTHATIDTNRNAIVFVNKTRESICPLAIVKQSKPNRLPAIVDNTFHANIVGKWK